MKTSLLSVILTVQLVMLASGSAGAATDLVKDPRNDVVRDNSETGGDITIGKGSPDVSGLRIKHTTTRVIAQLTFHHLTPRAAANGDYEVYLNTDSDGSEEYIFAYGEFEYRYEQPRYGVYSADPARTQRICHIASKFSPSRGVVTFSASRKCLKGPLTVKASAAIMSHSGPEGERHHHRDSIQGTRRVPPG